MTDHLIKLENLQELDNLELLARQVVEGFIIGLHKSPFHGFSVEFAEHRLYNPGESTRNIDWKVFARTDRMYTKKFEEETNLRCQIVIDGSSSMYYPEEAGNKIAVNKMNFSVMAASALMHLLKKQRDAAGLSVFTDHVEMHTKAKTSNIHHRLIYSYLRGLLSKKETLQKTAAAKALHEIAENIPRRSMVMIFSDMMDNMHTNDHQEGLDELFSALQHLRYNKHEVILFHVVDRKHEIDFAFENRPYQFIDLETGEKVKLHTNQVKDFYIEQVGKFKKELEMRCAQYEIDFVEADVNKDFSQVLIPYLVKRTKLF